MTKKALKQYGDLKKEVSDIEQRIIDAQTSEGLSKKNLELRLKTLEMARVRVERKLADIEAAIAALDSEERRIVRHRYVDDYAWIRVAWIMNMSERSVMQIHREALRKLERS